MRANAERDGERDGERDAVSAELSALLARLGELAAQAEGPGDVTDAVRIDRIALLEEVRSGVAAAQHSEMVAFGRSQAARHQEQIASGRLDPAALGRGIADQIALACRVSPSAGSRRLGVARALHAELPATRTLLRRGEIGEDLAERVVSETRHLDPASRRRVDAQLATDGLDQLSPRRAAAAARRRAYEVDPAGYTARGRTARADRRVWLRPAPDTMSTLSGLLPVEQGVACLASLRAHTDRLVAGGDGRARDQIMADTLVERLTGQARAGDVDVEVNLVLPLDALLDPDTPATAEVVGHGPVPGRIARDLLADTAGRRWWRRLFTRPAAGLPGTGPLAGPLVGADPRRRRFDGVLADLIRLRDGARCRDPYCDAPIRHIDHVDRVRAGGPGIFTNGRGVCARGNYVREMPGWRVETVDDGLTGRPHTVRTTTPTGHAYTSRAGP